MLHTLTGARSIVILVWLTMTCSIKGQSIPSREWATYVGGRGNDNFRDMALDAQGNVYAIGSTGSTNNVATPGSHQVVLGGLLDVLIVKFNSKGDRIWGAYLGGPDFDFGQNIALDSKGNVFICGGTRSTTNFTTPGVFQSNFAGGSHDAFLAKFTNDGTLLWSTYIGGSVGEDASNGLCIDNQDQVYITGWTESPDNISTVGTHQENAGGRSDAYIMKFDNNGSRLWGTYLGDQGFDLGLQIALDKAQNVFISGWTSSTDNFTTIGAPQPTYSGGTADAYIAKFSPLGRLIWCTYAGGPQEDYGDVLMLDQNDFIYLAGPCNSVSGIATPGADQSTSRGAFDGFIMKLAPDGRKIWGTYLGGSKNDNAYGLALDDNQKIYVTGFTTSSNGITTNNSFQPAMGGETDVLLMKFDQDGQKEWGTYYGDLGIDEGWAVHIDGAQNIILAGRTTSVTNISTTFAHQPTFGGGLSDGLLVKFAPCTDPEATIAGRMVCTNDVIFDTIYPIGLAPYTLYITIDGNKPLVLNSTDSFIVLAVFGSQWSDSLRIDSIKSLDCKGELKGNTLYKTEKTLSYSPLQIICNPSNFTYTVNLTTNGLNTTLVSSPQFRVTGDRIESIAIPSDQGYSVKFAHPAGCDTITLTGSSGCVRICPPIQTAISPLSPVCIGDTVIIVAQGRGRYVWSGPSGFISFLQNPIIPINSANQAGLFTLITSDSSGCTDTLTTSLIVFNRPAIMTSSNSPQCINGVLQLTTTAANNYTWTGPNNFSSALQNPTIAPLNQTHAGRYRVNITNQNGCKNFDSTDIVIQTIAKTIITSRDSICQNESAELNASGSGSFIWSSGDRTSRITSVPRQTTTYRVIRTEGACADTAQRTISVKPLPNVAISGPTSLFQGQSIQLKATGAKSYAWSPAIGLSCVSCDQPMASPAQDIIYCVTGGDNGCIDTACIPIEVRPECKLFLPNIFTPNGDNINEEWCPITNCIQIIATQIFDRWGSVVYQSNENNPCWDGRSKGQDLTSAVYIFLIEAVDENGLKFVRKGDLTLIK